MPLGKWELNVGLYMMLVGLVLVAVAVWVVPDGQHTVAGTLGLAGSASLLTAPFADRIIGKMKVGPLEVELRDRVLAAARSAPSHSLRAVLPLLDEAGVAVAVVKVPESFDGRSVTDAGLSFVRQRMQLTILALEQDDGKSWIAGGKVSETPLKVGQQMLICGAPGSLDYFRMLAENDDSTLWDKVR